MVPQSASELASYPVVDSSDNVLFYANRKQIHEDYLKHRSIHVSIEVAGGLIFLQEKANGTENAGLWSTSVSGHVEAKESYEDAAIREIYEELGIKVASNELRLVRKFDPCRETGNEFVTLYTYLMDRKTSRLTVNTKEIKRVVLMPYKEVALWIGRNRFVFSPAFLKVFAYLYINQIM